MMHMKFACIYSCMCGHWRVIVCEVQMVTYAWYNLFLQLGKRQGQSKKPPLPTRNKHNCPVAQGIRTSKAHASVYMLAQYPDLYGLVKPASPACRLSGG